MRATLEVDPEKRPWNKGHAVYIAVMKEHANLPREAFDIKWVNMEVRVSVRMVGPGGTMVPTAIATFTIGQTWVLNLDNFRRLALGVDIGAIQSFLGDV